MKQPADHRTHKGDNTDGKLPQCTVCQRRLPDKRSLRDHMKAHTGDKPYLCPVCKRAFSLKANMRRHMMLHTGERPYKCSLCDAAFIEKRSLQAHTLSNHTKGKHHKCDQCDSEFALISDLKIHKISHRGKNPYKCSICKKRFAQQKILNQHMGRYHTGTKPKRGTTQSDTSLIQKSDVAQPTGNKSLVCSVCKKKFVYQGRLKRHMLLAHTGGKRKMSSKFNKTLIEKSGLARRKTQMGTSMNSSKARKHFGCKPCNKRFILKSELNKHMATHIEDKTHACNSCSKKFCSFETLKQHISTHKVEKRYKCSVCNEGFVKLEYLKRHMSNHSKTTKVKLESLIHSEVKLHKCIHCHKAFARKLHLDEHLLTHKGEKPYKCSTCDKRFRWLPMLEKHTMTHPGEKPHKCTRCKMRFAHKPSLLRHIRSHTVEKRLKCPLCGELYRRSENFNRHIMTHTGERPHKCALCDADFILNKELNAHMRKKHPGVDQYLRIGDPRAPKKRNSKQSGGTSSKRRAVLGTHKKQRSKHTGDKPYKCSHCNKAFIYESVFNRHVATHKIEKHFKCSHCSKMFVYKSLFNQHMMTHREEQLHECSYCDKEFVHKSVFRRHMETHDKEEERYKCKECGAEFMVLENLEHHKVKHTQAYLDNFEPPMTPCSEDHSYIETESHKCWHCDAGFPSQPDLFKHITAHICFICSDIFCQFEYLQEHIKTHAEADLTKCLRCGETFTNKSNFLKHLKTHTLKEPEQAVEVKNYVLKIKKTKEGGRSYGCSGCEKEFIDLLAACSHAHGLAATESSERNKGKISNLNLNEDLTVQRTACELDDDTDMKEDVLSQINPNFSDCLMCKNGFLTHTELERHLVAHRYMVDIAQCRGYH